MVFWEAFQAGKVDTIINEKERKIKFKLNVPYQTLSGNWNLRAVPCSHSMPLDGAENVPEKEMNGPVTFPQPSV
jgi:hypothetical protein